MTISETMTLIEKTVFLKSVDVLAGIPTEALARLAARATEMRCERGNVVFREGDEDQGTFIVVEGQLELRSASSVVRLLGEGMAQGELFLGENDLHQYTAIAREDTHLLNLRRADVFDALLEHPEFGLATVQDLALRLHKLTQRVIELEAEQKQGAPDSGKTPAAGAIEPIEPVKPVKPIEQVDPVKPIEPVEPVDPAAEEPKRRSWWRLPRRAGRPPV